MLHKLCDDLNRFHENKIIQGNLKKNNVWIHEVQEQDT